MDILGISAFYHDSAAALLREGNIMAAAQEERFTRKKHDSGFPHRAIQLKRKRPVAAQTYWKERVARTEIGSYFRQS